ncbi:uncharacterized protein T551_01582 [Pneumocystis jirovecii RU7]|uniref:Mitochondrial thiamine pyrophosphate carrier 1 n=1 Tax=Pneumocystis jirovecii (strain RU7) TaxID=1408657 RepID=A0A0W4ZRL9_PNEJ7|nr:uncharacterized protein T551_01582 [Pneumocystis jirovecii RU7]KTW31030.1 hypothetical protein T551_01582 [Pneumocystis jirovecii RU7]
MDTSYESLSDAYEYEALPKNSSFLANMLAGAFAGIMEHTLMYPVDAIKTRLQIVSSSYAIHTSIIQSLRWMVSSEGARSLWRGISSVVAGAGPAHALYFGTYEFVKYQFSRYSQQDGVLPTGLSVMAGASATIASDALMNPFDVIKQRMQIRGSEYTSAVNCARVIFKKEGLWAFYISYPTTLTMTIPFAAIQFLIYESSLNILNPQHIYNPITHIISGGIAGAVAAATTTPLDVVKTLLQTRGTSSDDRIRNCKGLRGAISIIYEKHGLEGFMRGIKPRVVTAIPSTAICWMSYEAGKEVWFRFSKNT